MPFTTTICVQNLVISSFFKKWANPGLFLVYFRSFQTNIITIFRKNNCEKCPSSIRCLDSNPRPLEREPLPITTRPGLPPDLFIFSLKCCFLKRLGLTHNRSRGLPTFYRSFNSCNKILSTSSTWTAYGCITRGSRP